MAGYMQLGMIFLINVALASNKYNAFFFPVFCRYGAKCFDAELILQKTMNHIVL